MKNKEEHKLYNSNFAEAFSNAMNGIFYTIKTQKSIKIQLVIAILVIIFSLFMNLTKIEYLFLIFSIFLVILAEMLNTAIETVVNLYTDSYNEKAKIAKDVGAGAVVIASLNSIIIAYFLFFDKICEIIKNIFNF